MPVHHSCVEGAQVGVESFLRLYLFAHPAHSSADKKLCHFLACHLPVLGRQGEAVLFYDPTFNATITTPKRCAESCLGAPGFESHENADERGAELGKWAVADWAVSGGVRVPGFRSPRELFGRCVALFSSHSSGSSISHLPSCAPRPTTLHSSRVRGAPGQSRWPTTAANGRLTFKPSAA